MATEMGLSPLQAGTLLTGFFPGYLITQMPAGPIVQRIGGKLTLSVCLFGTAVTFLLAPAVMSNGGVAAMSVLLSLNGLLTGPMMPTLQQLNRDWIPDGDADENQERPLVVRIQNLAHNSAPMLGAFLTPLLARGGWKRAFYILGGVVSVWGVIWHTMVNSSRGNSAPAPAKAAEGDDKDKPAEKVTEWRIFTLKPVISLICWQVASNFLFAVLQILGPTYYTGTLKVSPERAGVLLALAQLVNFVSAAALSLRPLPLPPPQQEAVAQPGTALGGMAEAMMLKRMPALAMSKTLTIAASFGEAAFALLYGMASTANGATLAYGGVTLASMFQRAWSNYYEIGGKDVATLGSVTNTSESQQRPAWAVTVARSSDGRPLLRTVANVANMATPAVGLFMMNLFNGSAIGLLALSAFLKVAAGLWLAKEMSTVDGRCVQHLSFLALEHF